MRARHTKRHIIRIDSIVAGLDVGPYAQGLLKQISVAACLLPEKPILKIIAVSGAFEGRAASGCVSWITVGSSEHIQRRSTIGRLIVVPDRRVDIGKRRQC